MSAILGGGELGLSFGRRLGIFRCVRPLLCLSASSRSVGSACPIGNKCLVSHSGLIVSRSMTYRNHSFVLIP